VKGLTWAVGFLASRCDAYLLSSILEEEWKECIPQYTYVTAIYKVVTNLFLLKLLKFCLQNFQYSLKNTFMVLSKVEFSPS